MSAASIVVITAGLGQPSSTRLLGERLANATTRALAGSGTAAEVQIVELREYAHDLTDQLLTGFPSARLAELIEQVIAADGIIAVTPIFSASYSGLFKMFFDVLQPDSLASRPVLVAATAGTARHSLALEHAVRPLFAYLRTVVVPTAVFAATEDWGGGGLPERIERAAGELARLLAPGRQVAARPVQMATPFAELLAQSVGDRS